MANYFVDSTTGDDGDNGTTMDLAWATLEYALVSGGLIAGDIVWVRRVHSELPGQISVVGTGDPDDPIQVIGWPRNSDTITGATWTQGSRVVDNITGLSMDREKHMSRYIVGPDGKTYVIAMITDSDTIELERNYVGADQTGANGAATIQADSDYALAQAIDDSGWTITKATYNADADDLPLVDFNSAGNYFFWSSDRWWRLANLDVTGSTGYGMFRFANAIAVVEGCLLKQADNVNCIYTSGGYLKMIRCVLEGTGSGASERGFTMLSGAVTELVDTPIYGCQDEGIYNAQSTVFLDNVPVGIHSANGTDIGVYTTGLVTGKDVALGNGDSGVAFNTVLWGYVKIENYNNVYGAHKVWTEYGTMTKIDVFGGSGDPEKRTNGADSIIEIDFDTSTQNPISHFAPVVFEHEFEVNSEAKNFKYYVQATNTISATDMWLEAEYVSSYTSSSRYVKEKIQSDETIAARGSASDWSQYLEVALTPGKQEGYNKVRIKLICRYYSATGKIYIDPNPEIT